MKDENEALTRFMAHVSRSRSALERLLAHLDDHMGVPDPEDVHWGHVGSASYMREALEALVQELDVPERK